MHTADEIADQLLALAHARGESVNNLKLQKLLYYAQAWHLARRDEPLFPEKFQAWASGPVIPALYWRFKQFGIGDVPVPAGTAITPEIEPLLREVMESYGSLDEYELSSMTYREAPWAAAHAGYDIGDPCGVEIDEGEMRAYFRRLAEMEAA